MAMLLALARGLFGHDRAARSGPAQWRWGVTPTFRLTGKTLGIVGLGRIGGATALRARAFGLRVVFYDPYRSPGWEKTFSIERARTLNELVATSDIVSLHTPLTDETKGMMSRSVFAAMKPGTVLINTARGPIVDWPAFREALDRGIVASAGFDVLPIEPLDMADPVLGAWARGDERYRDRLVISPHAASIPSRRWRR